MRPEFWVDVPALFVCWSEPDHNRTAAVARRSSVGAWLGCCGRVPPALRSRRRWRTQIATAAAAVGVMQDTATAAINVDLMSPPPPRAALAATGACHDQDPRGDGDRGDRDDAGLGEQRFHIQIKLLPGVGPASPASLEVKHAPVTIAKSTHFSRLKCWEGELSSVVYLEINDDMKGSSSTRASASATGAGDPAQGDKRGSD